ncbi:hypothetical protein ACMA1I_04705 [Pontibacter sp. 13R65]
MLNSPLFEAPVQFELGEKVLMQYGVSADTEAAYDTGFWFQDFVSC